LSPASPQSADHKTFELVAERGQEPADLERLFAGLDADDPNSIDGVHDEVNMSLEGEPRHVRDDLAALRAPS